MSEHNEEPNSESNGVRANNQEAKKKSSSQDNITRTKSNNKAQPDKTILKKVDNTNSAVIFIIVPALVILGSLILLLMRVWDWTTALGVSALIITGFAYINDLLKPKITRKSASEDLRKNVLGFVQK